MMTRHQARVKLQKEKLKQRERACREKREKEKQDKDREARKIQELEKEYDSIHRFLLFNFILANDTHAVRTILKQKYKMDMTLAGNDLENYLKDTPPFGSSNSILSVDRFRTLFRSCLRAMQDHRDKLKRLSLPLQETNERQNYDINLLELASILCDTFESTDMLVLILKNRQYENFKEYVSIAICNPAVNKNAVAQLLSYSFNHYGKFYGNMTKLSDLLVQIQQNRCVRYFMGYVYEYASALIFAYFQRRQNDAEVPFTHQDMISTKSKIKRFFDIPRKAIEERNSSVFKMCSAENASSEYSVEDIVKLIHGSLASNAWYILHLILTNKSFEDKLVWKNSYINRNHPLFITMYMLNTFLAFHKSAVYRKDRNAVKQLGFKELEYPYKYGGEELLVWIVCTYMIKVGNTVQEKYRLSDIFNANILTANGLLRSTRQRTMYKLFIHFGVDVNNGNSGHESPMCNAISDCDMQLVRTLLYHNYTLGKDDAVTKALNDNKYSFLRVLLLCGAQLPAKTKESVTNEPITTYISAANKAAVIWLKQWLGQPHSLASLCRKSLREHYGAALTPLLMSLDDRYPENLIRYLRTEVL